GLLLPAIILALPWMRNVKGVVTASILINIGMWLKRYIIVVPTLSEPYMPIPNDSGRLAVYVPTLTEWAIVVGGFAAFCLFYVAFEKLFPIVSIWETAAGATATASASVSPIANQIGPGHVKSGAVAVALAVLTCGTIVSATHAQSAPASPLAV